MTTLDDPFLSSSDCCAAGIPAGVSPQNNKKASPEKSNAL
jgi:hypothetical protein